MKILYLVTYDENVVAVCEDANQVRVACREVINQASKASDMNDMHMSNPHTPIPILIEELKSQPFETHSLYNHETAESTLLVVQPVRFLESAPAVQEIFVEGNFPTPS